jgi:uncharacterized protein YycO
MILRGVRHKDKLSDLIIMNTGGVLAHFEGIMEGGTVIGAFAEGGVQERPLNYDGGIFAVEILFELPASDEMNTKFEHYLRACVGEPYDYSGIVNFIHPGADLHSRHHVVCSALIQAALRGIGGDEHAPKWWSREMPIDAHYVTPLILHQELLADQRTRIITRDDPVFLAHIAKNA